MAVVSLVLAVFFMIATLWIFTPGKDNREMAYLLVRFGAPAALLILAIVIMPKVKLKKHKWYQWYTPVTGGAILACITRWIGLVPETAFIFTTVAGMWLVIFIAWLLSLDEKEE